MEQIELCGQKAFGFRLNQIRGEERAAYRRTLRSFRACAKLRPKQHDFVDSKHFAVMLAEKANVIRMCSSLTPECIFHMDKKFTSIHKMSEYTRS